MNINRVTISGADNEVSKDDMLYTQEVFPFVEWGILVSTKRMGTYRYPTLEWIKNLHYDLNLSFHLCGDLARNFVDGGTDWVKISEDVPFTYNRLQLNFSFKEDKDYIDNLTGIAFTATRWMSTRSIILAYNKGNKKNIDEFIRRIPSAPGNLHYLYDSSGGRGTEIKTFHKPLHNYTGYAGGIGLHNVRDVCEALSNMEWQDDVWIDLESGARTNDKFDIKKVNSILAICAEYVNNGNKG